MADTAAWLVDHVLPEAPVRQWVLTLPFALRYRLAFDAELITVVLAEFMRAVFSSLRRRARHEYGIAKPRCGAVTFVQRFGDALNLNIHFHSVVLDGVYEDRGDDVPRFHPLPPPDDREIALIAARMARRIAQRFKQRGLGPNDEPWQRTRTTRSATASCKCSG